MAKARAEQKVGEALVPDAPGVEPKDPESLVPEKVHELFGLPGPYEPPPRPLGLKGFATFWDPGVSIRSLVKQHRKLFYLGDYPEKFAGESDQWRWKQIRLRAAGPGDTFAEQRKRLKLGDPAAAREVVTFLVLHFLGTGERLDVPRLRCKEITASGRRVLVGPFHELGLDIANASDEWTSPGIDLAEVVVPARRK